MIITDCHPSPAQTPGSEFRFPRPRSDPDEPDVSHYEGPAVVCECVRFLWAMLQLDHNLLLLSTPGSPSCTPQMLTLKIGSYLISRSATWSTLTPVSIGGDASYPIRTFI